MAPSARQRGLVGEEVFQKHLVDCDWVRGVREGRTSGRLSWGDLLPGRPDVVQGGFSKEISPVGGFGPFDGFEVAELGLSCHGVGVGGP